jgi:hypothetical protein
MAFLCSIAGAFCVNRGPDDPAAVDDLSGLGAHGHYSADRRERQSARAGDRNTSDPHLPVKHRNDLGRRNFMSRPEDAA